jgi:hypothetical protein
VKRPKSTTAKIRALAQSPASTRFLTCTTCGDTVEVGEVPRGWIDARVYRCGECSLAGARSVTGSEAA